MTVTPSIKVWDSTLGQWVFVASGSGGGETGGVTDHGALTGLTDDDHTQYLTDARGDTRYVGTATPQFTTGAAAQVGTATKLAREDHRHSVVTGAPVALGSAIALGSAQELSRADHVHPYPSAANVGAAALSHTHVIGDLPTGTSASTVAIGSHTHATYALTTHSHVIGDLPTGTTSTTVSLGNHLHAGVYEASGAVATHAATAGHEALSSTTPAVLYPNITSTVGVGTTAARSDHTHGLLAGTPTTPLSPATTDSAGVAASVARSDHTHALAIGSPVALGAANAAGTAAYLARSDHVHIYPTLGQLGAAATSHTHLIADLPTGTSGTTVAIGNHTHSYEAAGAVATHDALSTAHSALRGTVAPATLTAGAAVVGTSTKFAREDHKHYVSSTDPPVALGPANAVGSLSSFARADHVHIFPTATDVGALPIGGGTLTGPLLLAADPAVALGAATKQYVDNKASPPEAFVQAAAPGAGSTALIWLDTDDTSLVPGAAAYVRTDGDTMTGALTMPHDQPINFGSGPKISGDYGALRLFGGSNPIIVDKTIVGVTPTASDHLTTKAYVDGKISGGLYVQTGTPSLAVPPTGYPLWLDTDEPEVSVALGNRNRIVNGDFSVNQRGYTSGTANAYGLDRWGGYKVGGGTMTYSAQTPALGELPESARAYARIVTSGQSAAGDIVELYQSIENVRSLSGKTVNVSFWAKAASGTPKVAVEFDQYFGTGGAPSADVYTYAGQVTLSTVWTRYSVTIAIPSVAGKVLGTSGNDALSLELITSAGSTFNARTGSLGIQSATIDFWGVQVEEGAVATPYEQKTYADELRACQRFFRRWSMPTSSTAVGTGLVYQPGETYVPITFPEMRGVPTITLVGTWQVLAGGTVLTGGATTQWGGSTTSSATFQWLGGTAGTTGQAAILRSGTTNNYIDFSADI